MAAGAVENPSAAGIRDFLKQLPEDEIRGILKATTGGLITCTSIEEAADAIVKYSDVITFLYRKRIRKEYLLKYLNLNHVKINLPTDKTKLIRTVLEFWGHTNCEHVKFKAEAVTSKNAESKHILKNAENVKDGHSFDKPQGQQLTHLGDTLLQTIEEPMEMGDEASGNLHNQAHQMVSSPQSSSVNACSAILRGQILGEDFSNWFYSGLNNSMSDFGPHHFWSDCNLRIECNTAGQQSIVEEVLHDGRKCCEEIMRLRTVRQLFFNPNPLPGAGIKGTLNPHGLAQVMVCGTLLINREFVGIFEQVFGLMMDPDANNKFKIKYSFLRLHETNQIRVPCLTDSSLSIIEDE